MFLRRLSRLTVVTASTVTFGRMPPFVRGAAIMVQDGNILMVRDIAQRKLVLPGGHLHWNESVEQGMSREVGRKPATGWKPLESSGPSPATADSRNGASIRVILEARNWRRTAFVAQG